MSEILNILGLMSGTSLDGIDMAQCQFQYSEKQWKYQIIHTETVPYSSYWEDILKNAHKLKGFDLLLLDIKYGEYLGSVINKFLKKHKSTIDFIASHGHTIFHIPEQRFTYQLGNGQAMATKTGIPVIHNFRLKDVLNGGQGAPLVPVGDQYLFDEYQFCINLGGFANVSMLDKGIRIAYDICPVNFALNLVSAEKKQKFDYKGKLAQNGKIISELLNELNQLEYYSKKPPKSLGREWFEKYFTPIFVKYNTSTEDKLRTLSEHISYQISRSLNFYTSGNNKALLTGGGVYNDFLIQLIREKSKAEINKPSDQLINFKEALVFAFLGLLNYRGKINCYSSVTGAKKNLTTGNIAYP